MADEKSQDDSSNAQTRPTTFQAAASQAREERKAQAEESGDVSESSENIEEGQESEEADPSAQDVKEREQEAESDEASEQSQETESDESDEEESPEEPEIAEDEEGPIPYERFKEVVDERNELRDSLDNVQSERDDLQQQLDHLLNTQEGHDKLVDFLEEQGVLGEGGGGDSDSSNSETLDEAMDTLNQFLTDEQVEAIRDVVRAEAGAQSESDDESDELDRRTVQERQRRIRNKLEAMDAREGEFEHLDELSAEPYQEGAGQTTWMDKVANENPDRFTDETGLPTPDDLELLYYKALEEAGITGENGSGGSSDKDVQSSSDRESLKEEVREEVEQELEEAKEKEPVTPSGGSPDMDEPQQPKSLRDSLREAAEEEGVSLS